MMRMMLTEQQKENETKKMKLHGQGGFCGILECFEISFFLRPVSFSINRIYKTQWNLIIFFLFRICYKNVYFQRIST